MVEFRTLALVATPYCPNHCGICGASYGKGTLSLPTMKRCVDQAVSIGASNLGITGGEPTTRAETLDIMRYAKDSGLVVGMNSSGTYAPTRKASDDYTQKMVECGLDYLTLSVGTHHGMHVPYDSWLNALRSAEKFDLGVGINTPLCHSNLEESGKILSRLAKDLGGNVDVDSEKKTPCIVARGRQVDVALGAIQNVGRARSIKEDLVWYSPLPEEGCKAREIMVTNSGNILPCCSFYAIENQGAYSLGNVYKNELSDAVLRMKQLPMGKFFGNRSGQHMKNVIESIPEGEKIANGEYTSVCELCGEFMKDLSINYPEDHGFLMGRISDESVNK
jgi:hypothetical protein